MKSATSSDELTFIEKLILAVNTPPWDAVYRAAIGFAMIPVASWVWMEDRSGWRVAPFLLGVLVMLRVVPAVIRKVAPFSDAILGIWFEQRQLAKRYDSYQWQKLLWIGFGSGFYTIVSGRLLTSSIIVSSVCLLAGALGMARWRAVAPRTDVTSAPAKPMGDLARPSAVTK